MDPNASLKEIREITAAMNEGMFVPQIMAAAARLNELVSGLDNWVSNNGYLPDDWAEGRATDEVYVLTVKASYGMDQTYHLTEKGAMNTYRETCALDPEGEGLAAPRLPKSLKREMLLP